MVGLDPVVQHVPQFIRERAIELHGNTLKGAAEALWYFNEGLLESLHPWIPAVKLQMACYELYGSFGMDVHRRTVEMSKKLGLLVLDDSKRNDIGNTAYLYAAGHLGKSPLIEGDDDGIKADFLTINPYLGSDGIRPFIGECEKHNKGLFILVRTSNPSSQEYQEAKVADLTLYKKVAKDVDTFGRNLVGDAGFSSIGAVVGATWPNEAAELREIMPKAYFLVPGYGAQGAVADNVVHAFDKNGYGAIINSSRAVIFAYQDEKYRSKSNRETDYAQIAVDAVKEMRHDILTALSRAGRLPNNWRIN